MVIPLLEKQFFFESCVVSKIFLSFKITAAISFLKSVIFHFSYRSISLILSFHSLLKMNNPYQIIPSFSNFFFFLIFLLNLIENFLFFKKIFIVVQYLPPAHFQCLPLALRRPPCRHHFHLQHHGGNMMSFLVLEVRTPAPISQTIYMLL